MLYSKQTSNIRTFADTVLSHRIGAHRHSVLVYEYDCPLISRAAETKLGAKGRNGPFAQITGGWA